MKSLKTSLLMVVMLLSLTLTLRAAQEIDILDFLPAFIKAVPKNCNFPDLQQTFQKYAGLAAAKVGPADKAIVISYVNQYPEGGAPPTLVDKNQGGYNQNIPSRAAAFFLAGVQAVLQQNRAVAFWCFSEAAARNPHSAIFLNNAGFALIEYGYLEDALQALKCAKNLEPDFISPYINLGKALGLLGRCAEAAENYNTGFLKFPNNPHYLWRAAKAYKCAQKLPQAWGLGAFGKDAFPGVYDWDGFLTSLNYTPPAPYPATNCPNQGSCPPGTACGTLIQRIFQYATEMHAQREDYMGNVEIPALNRADEKWLSCINTNGACVDVCQAQFHDPYYKCGYYCCTMQCTVEVSGCISSYDATKISILSTARAFHVSKLNEYMNRANDDYQATLSKLNTTQAAYAQCVINAYNDTSITIGNYNADIIKYQTELQRMYSDIATATSWCAGEKVSCSGGDPKYEHFKSNAGYIEWASTGGFTTSLEPKYCLTVFCFSYDAVSGNFGFEVGAGLAGKFTRNAFTGETAINLGVGLKLGAGMSSIGGSAWVKLSPNKVGVEAKVNAGPAKIGYFYGSERL